MNSDEYVLGVTSLWALLPVALILDRPITTAQSLISISTFIATFASLKYWLSEGPNVNWGRFDKVCARTLFFILCVNSQKITFPICVGGSYLISYKTNSFLWHLIFRYFGVWWIYSLLVPHLVYFDNFLLLTYGYWIHILYLKV